MGNLVSSAPITVDCDAYGIIVFGLKLLQDAARRVDSSLVLSPTFIISSAVVYQQNNDGLSPGEVFDEALTKEGVKSCAEDFNSQMSSEIEVGFRDAVHVEEDFKPTADTVIRIQYLFNEDAVNVQYAEDDVFKVLAVPCSNPSDRRFLVFLPKEEQDLDAALNEMDAQRYLGLMQELYEATVYAKVPKISIDQCKLEFGELSNVASLSVTNQPDDSESPTLPSQLTSDHFLSRLPPRDPIKFVADQPFMFAMDDGKIPMFFGIFNGN